MASGKDRGSWNQEEESGGSGSWLLAGLKVGAAIGAAALGAYAAVKVSQEMEKEKEPPMRSSCSSSREDEKRQQSFPDARAPPPSKPLPKRKPSSSLVVDLHEYYLANVEDSTGKMAVKQNLVEKTGRQLSSFLIKNHRRLFRGELTLGALDKLVPRQLEEFKLMLPLAFDSKKWEFIDASDTILNMPGYRCVRRVNLDFFHIGSSPWDPFLVGSYLCPELLQEFLKKILQKMIRDGIVFDFYCTVRRNASGVELGIENPFGPNSDMLQIKIIPYMDIKDVRGDLIRILAKSVTSSHQMVVGGGSESGNPHENLWLQSLEEKAVQQMEALDSDGGCRWKCLAILDALRRSHPPLKVFSLYQLMTVLLRVCEEETEWDHEMLAERFVDLLKALEGYLRAGCLIDCFNDKVNVFVQLSSGHIMETQKWLAYMLESKDRILDLLLD